MALFTGREAEVFPKMKEACERGLAKGADVIVLGSTTLSQAGPYLSENLPVPVVNPGPLSLTRWWKWCSASATATARWRIPSPPCPAPR